ncbi:MAG TPA: D-arabinono-1,4-lactone oxidase [Pseudonocardia sp.]|jgi:L-gulono-1,4-lactone dehydrogenase|nr:D-arabinono-1,4-lactone oxidase [Pseudonocardia sp.]
MWTNWSGGQQCRPSATVRPLDEAGVRAAVQRAARRGVRVRPVGAGHSFSPLAATDDILLDLSALTGLVRVSEGPQARVRVRAGTTLAGLNVALAQRGLALATLADVDTPTVAGAVATGTHGSTSRSGSLSAQVTGMRMVQGSGAAVEVTGADLDAARIGLGALGVVTEVELAVRPELVLRASQARLPLDDVLRPDYLDAHRWAEFSVFPYTEDALARWADEVTDQPDAPSRVNTVRTFVERRLVRAAAVGGGVALGRTVPRLVPTINRAATVLTGSGSVTDLAHRVLVARPVVRWEESEWALPREALAEAVRELLAAISERELDVGFPLEVRVGPAESGWLHPAYGRATGWVAVHTATGTDPEPLFGLTADVLGAHGGRPHWGKRHPWTADRIAAAYPKLPDWLAVRDRYDPERVFTNPYLATLLG